jgi:hypothetical protein
MVSHGDRLDALEHGDGRGFASAWKTYLDSGVLPAAEALVAMVLTGERSRALLRGSGDLAPRFTPEQVAERLRLIDDCTAADPATRDRARAELQRIAAREGAERRAAAPWRGPHAATAPPPASNDVHGGDGAPPVAPSPGDSPNRSPGLPDPTN